MAEENNQRNLSGLVSEELYDKFINQADRLGIKVKRAVAAAAKLWAELPPEIQVQLLDQSLNSDSFLMLVRQIADERIAAAEDESAAARDTIKKRRNRGRRKSSKAG